MRRVEPALLFAAAGLLLVLTAPRGGWGEEVSRLRFCNPDGGTRAEKKAGGVRIHYVDKRGRPLRIDFTLSGWRIETASSGGRISCVTLGRIEEASKPGRASGAVSRDVLSARDEVIVYGGAFQEKVILRRGQRVIILGGEKIVIEETEILRPD